MAKCTSLPVHLFYSHGSINAYILAFVLAYTSNKLGLRMCIDTLFLNGFSLINFFLYPWEMLFLQYLLWMLLWYQSSIYMEIYFLNVCLNIYLNIYFLKYIIEKVYQRNVNIKSYVNVLVTKFFEPSGAVKS